MINKYPNLKHLKIVINGQLWKATDSLLKMIKENNTLESLGIVVRRGKNMEDWPQKELTEGIQNALKESAHIQDISLVYSPYTLDTTGSYVTSYDALGNYKITGKEIILVG